MKPKQIRRKWPNSQWAKYCKRNNNPPIYSAHGVDVYVTARLEYGRVLFLVIGDRDQDWIEFDVKGGWRKRDHVPLQSIHPTVKEWVEAYANLIA